MPHNAGFFLPFETRSNPDAGRAGERHLAWVVDHGLVRGAEALRRYRGWLLTDLAAWAFPDALGPDLDLVTDAVCLGFPLADQFDLLSGRQPERVAWLCTELAAIPYRAPGARPMLDRPVTRAYADVWERAAAGMSPAWRERAAGNLTRFFRSFVAEAQYRHLGVRLGEEAYLALRRQAAGTAPCFDLIERAGHAEVPAGVYWSREVQTLTRCAGDVVLLCDDLHAVRSEETRGAPHNLVLIRERDAGCSRAEATAQVSALAAARAELFLAVSERLPELYARWRLDARGVAGAERYVEGLRCWMAAVRRWGAASGRYAGPAAPDPDPAAVPARDPDPDPAPAVPVRSAAVANSL
ncbi:terpene synthase family protein [Streptomyces sp. URMC 129]|uniref:terpene synthase family protein n=1 Tax=Streptomyces sp. URMC 129 TaxID=3423407 RepID=UPI003F193498